MNPSPPFNALQKILIARGVSRAYARRYAQELADHRDDILHELQSHSLSLEAAHRLADERLGPTDLLANAAIATYQSQTLMGRHPRIFFAALPLFFIPLLFSLAFLLIILPFAWTGLFSNGVPPRLQPLLIVLFDTFKYAIPALIGILYYRATRRRALSRTFRITASAYVILWSSFFVYSLSFHSPGPHGQLLIGLGTHPNLSQALAAASSILLYAWLSHRLSQKPILAS